MSPWASFKALYLGAIRRCAAANLPWFAAILILPAQQSGLASPMWLTTTYFLHTIGELVLSPVGLSAMTTLAPPRIGGLMMGIWFLATSVGNFIGGRVSGLYESFALPSLFGAVAGFAVVAGIVLLVVAPSMRKLMPE